MSIRHIKKIIYDYFMQETIAKTTIYNLINAGHLARQAMLVPLQSHGLVPGDDAILFALSNPNGESEENLCLLTSLDKVALDARLDRLAALEILQRVEIGNKNQPAARLSEKGFKVSNNLVANWQQLDEALIGELSNKEKDKLQKNLNRFIKLLSL
ncbi:MAG: hypothetical protein L3J15_02870 [Devosiaceae bacterium]|nr:hypothetical protein [Devosiaceae bacterium]